jgi:hypothetical protein
MASTYIHACLHHILTIRTLFAQITGPITKTISKQGIYKVYEMMNAADKEKFEKAYSASYLPAKEILQEIYDEVKSGTCLPKLHALHGNNCAFVRRSWKQCLVG